MISHRYIQKEIINSVPFFEAASLTYMIVAQTSDEVAQPIG